MGTVKRSHLHHTHNHKYSHTVRMITVSTMSPTMTEDTKDETKIDYPNLEMEEKTKEEEDITALEKDGLSKCMMCFLIFLLSSVLCLLHTLCSSTLALSD